MKFSTAILLATVAGSAGMAGAVSATEAVSTINIRGTVPVVCRVSVESGASATLSANQIQGTLREFCNSGAGYRVLASYSPQLASGKLIVDGRVFNLDGSGEIVISDSSHAAISAREIVIDSNGKKGGSIRFRIEPR
ncbi:hypothetical protein [Novosphingobium sp. MMS21-SN21R]|uniref:hypothetical protein n=1 Tax=Novosphingobium sp. MMS21-SN21R TaxID=2969298 RepID=UPI0028889938|nr:hypothetical protein [Novosphingobium sp. MMS21-SN21R]MDT0508327.1 hypothetical protein [Novosphingobium sp. MMS21-SN21R]